MTGESILNATTDSRNLDSKNMGEARAEVDGESKNKPNGDRKADTSSSGTNEAPEKQSLSETQVSSAKNTTVEPSLATSDGLELSSGTQRQNQSKAEQSVPEGTIDTSQTLEAALKHLKLGDVMTGLASKGKNVKDMAAYKFWGTQPVPKLGAREKVVEEGPFQIADLATVPSKPFGLIDGFEWVTMNLLDETELEEVFTLLAGHYVEDDQALFRFNYSKSFLKWALMAPGWTSEWHVGVRATTSRKLVAFISAIPMLLRVRQNTLHASEVNFLCVHKKLRAKRLTPVLIKEITRRCNLRGTWQAIYTAGVVLPKPISTCRYFHRSLDWQKLYEVGFSPLPPKSKPSYQVRNYALPDRTSTKNLRPMATKDIDGVLSLLNRYLKKFELAPVFSRVEIEHWLLNKIENARDQVIWSYVVQDPTTNAITDFFSFYCVESSVINHYKHKNVRAAYMFYYATEHGLSEQISRPEFAAHLNLLIHDALILAKSHDFDVFNALTLMDNNLFLEQQKFGHGDGQLHYYLYNFNANPIAGGVDQKNSIDGLSEVGVVML
ncbi:Glycylpeptide N-tetradecanoyltransferase [Blumeria hordei DH14]|uniref:Glycylpeptide N-tetradecanoyltransferase n=1 Tax=Blumeria graminis f. sp. hordei (strain DH14) TaxID=546991 RepID=N1J9J3_BLUG1|nr:Glycylpeptide N-tetradecanoyltransferase [Blumeria hordei DH14]